MEDAVKETAITVDQTEKDLVTSVALKEPTYSGLELQLAKFREACNSLYFLDLETAISRDVETRLWAAHGRVNSKFRSYLATLKDKSAKKKFVERRKAEELYKSFLKSSITFYRDFIQRLAARFKDVPEIFKIARGFGLDPESANSLVELDLKQKKALLRSCHATLIRLGDLSRYRETEIPKNANKRNWGPAVGYYDLAGALLPEDGQAFNQRAVISLANQDHLRAVYYLYRALTVSKPPEPVKRNLDVELRTIQSRYVKKEPLLPADSTSLHPELEALFLQFHARCHDGRQFDDHKDQCTKIVTGLAQVLKGSPYDSAVKKMCLISISASHYAEERGREAVQTDLEATTRFSNAYDKLQNLNIFTFIMLLQLLFKELHPIVVEGVGEMDQASCIARITPVCRRVLPHVRLYSSWLFSKAELLLRGHDQGRHPKLANLWQGYAATLNLLLDAFPIKDLPEPSYLLDEDQDMVAFTAFSDVAKKWRLLDSAGKLKASRSDVNAETAQRPEIEMLMRVKDFVKDGANFYRHKNDLGDKSVPLEFGEGRFTFAGTSTDDSSRHMPDASGDSLGSAVVHDVTVLANGAQRHATHPNRSRTDEMENMVDQLVGAEFMAAESPYLPTPHVSTLDDSPSGSRPTSRGLTAADSAQKIHQSSPAPPLASPALMASHRISLPDAFNTPFTPRLGETRLSSPRASTRQSNGSATSPLFGHPLSSNTAAFDHEIAHKQRDIQNRSSPTQFYDPTVTPASFYQTPTGFETLVRQHVSRPSNSSPWMSSIHSASVPGTEVPREIPQASPFGAIGDPRPKNAKTPTSGQPV